MTTNCNCDNCLNLREQDRSPFPIKEEASIIRITNGELLFTTPIIKTDENDENYRQVKCGACGKIYRKYLVVSYEYQLEEET